MLEAQRTSIANPVAESIHVRTRQAAYSPLTRGTLTAPSRNKESGTLSVDVVTGTFPSRVSVQFGKAAKQDTRLPDELVGLSPINRWRYLYQKRKSQFVLLVLAAFAWAVACFNLFAGVLLSVDNFLIRQAQAAPVTEPSGTSSAFVEPSNFFMIILGLFVVWALATITFSKTSEKIGMASDTLKVLLGLVVGYFSSLKAR